MAGGWTGDATAAWKKDRQKRLGSAGWAAGGAFGEGRRLAGCGRHRGQGWRRGRKEKER